MMKSLKGARVIEYDPIPLDSIATARVTHFINRQGNKFAAVAYVNQPEYVGLVCLRSESFDRFRESLGAFEAVAKSLSPAGILWRIEDSP
jgi:hypothetical protein